MRRIALACFGSLLLYAGLFGFILDRPLTYDELSRQMQQKLSLGTAMPGPKLVILAGSNAPYSHRCEVIGKLLGMPCVNGGIAVGIGLDTLLGRWRAVLRPGDVVYLPMEEAQYTRSRLATDVGPDGAVMFRHDWRALAALPPDRWAGAAFAFDLRFAAMAVIEHLLLAAHFRDPRAASEGGTNAWGDHVGHTVALAAASRVALAQATPARARPEDIRTGYGTVLIAEFLQWSRTHGVRAVGGLPTEFADAPMRDDTREAIRAVYVANGAGFVELPNRSLYARDSFFDTPDHLSEPWQIVHSVAVAQALAPLLGRRVARDATAPVENATGTAPEMVKRRLSDLRL